LSRPSSPIEAAIHGILHQSEEGMVTTAGSKAKKVVPNLVSLIAAVTLSFGASEALLRLKNASMKNYDIEMWRYAKELKTLSPNPSLGHEHLPNASAVLESVLIRTNAWGLRGGQITERPAPGTRRILILGSSIALGWGVDEDKTVSALLQRKFDAAQQKVEVLNAGIGNYNTERYVEHFLLRLTPLKPTDILVLAFVRDGEELSPGGGNFLLRNSELAVTIWTASSRLFGAAGEKSLVDLYRAVYAPHSQALAVMQEEFAKLADYAKAHDIRVTLAMVPDVHSLESYPLGFVHDIFAATSRKLGFTYVDLLPALQGLTPEEVWAMPGDPHPNARGHAIMADAIYPVLAAETQSSVKSY
jgi:lysophospholipase L1-like esterase